MHGRRFTWLNEWEALTMTMLDHVLVSVDWELEHTTSCSKRYPRESQTTHLYTSLQARYAALRGTFASSCTGQSWKVSGKLSGMLASMTAIWIMQTTPFLGASWI